MTIRVLVADDQALVRAGFVALLDAQDGIDRGRRGRHRDPRQLASARESAAGCGADGHPDAGAWTGWRRRAQIAADPALADVRVVVLTTFELDEYVFEAMRAGASGFLVKHTEPAELVRAVRVVADGEALLSPSVTRQAGRRSSPPGRRQPAGQPTRAGRADRRASAR